MFQYKLKVAQWKSSAPTKESLDGTKSTGTQPENSCWPRATTNLSPGSRHRQPSSSSPSPQPPNSKNVLLQLKGECAQMCCKAIWAAKPCWLQPAWQAASVSTPSSQTALTRMPFLQIVDENPRAIAKPFTGATAAAGPRRPLGDVSNSTSVAPGASKAVLKVL